MIGFVTCVFTTSLRACVCAENVCSGLCRSFEWPSTNGQLLYMRMLLNSLQLLRLCLEDVCAVASDLLVIPPFRDAT